MRDRANRRDHDLIADEDDQDSRPGWHVFRQVPCEDPAGVDEQTRQRRQRREEREMSKSEHRGDPAGPRWRGVAGSTSWRPPVTAPMPLLLAPVPSPVAGTPVILSLRPLDHFFGAERRTARRRAFLTRAPLRDDEHHRDINKDARSLADQCRQDEPDPDKCDVNAEIRRKPIAHAGDHRAVGVAVQPLRWWRGMWSVFAIG